MVILSQKYLSLIIPVFNEEESINLLYEKISHTFNNNLSHLKGKIEIIFVNDGSTDKSIEKIKNIIKNNNEVRLIDLVRNYGQSTAMSAGIDHAIGKLIVFMDADLQNDPLDIPKMINKLEEGYDLINGWRKSRQDRRFTRVLPSKIANWLISTISGLKLHDYGCTLKICRSSILKKCKLYGEMHRFIPLLVYYQGGKIGELVVDHHERKFGYTKYGLNRTYKVISDLMLLKFMENYSAKPIHLFGGFGIISFGVSLLLMIWMFILKFFYNTAFSDTPLPLIFVLFFLIGILSFFFGFIAGIVVWSYHESSQRKPYQIREENND